VVVCSYCGRPNAPDARFCSQCGGRLSAVTERHDERKVISVLFADLVGFTSRAETMDVEDVQAVLDPYYALVREQLEPRGGTVEKFIGDAVVAIFGVPVAHEDDPERAVRAGLAIREEVAAFNERHPDLDLHVRVAVTTGEALVAVDVSPDTGETFASGDIVNTAARLQAAAPVDGVVVGEGTWRATRDAIDYEEAEPVVAKGKREPVLCWQALRARSRLDQARRGHSATRMVGRTAERDALLEAFTAATEGRSVRALTIVGVPGVGKSRLVHELGRHVDDRPALVRWREGRCAPYGTGLAFSALADVVKAEAGVLESHELEAASAKLRHAVRAVVDDPDEARWIEGHLRPLVGLESHGATPGDHRAEEFAAWRRFLERLAQRRATVLVFEDLHWADEALLDFLDHLVAWAANVPLLVICTTRPDLLERRSVWGAGARAIRLEPLSVDETHELLDALLGPDRLP
jgi:class 3 adenylate cyclase